MEFLKLEDDEYPSSSHHDRRNLLELLGHRQLGETRRHQRNQPRNPKDNKENKEPQKKNVAPPPLEVPATPTTEAAPPPVCSSLRGDLAGEVAEENFIQKEPIKVIPCQLKSVPTDPLGLGVQPHLAHPALSSGTRSTFLMAFSPCRTLMASTHGDHSLYVSRVSDGSCVTALTGHPRTPWCVAFHPSLNGVLASGCLGGQVRVWDLQGHSEVWQTQDSIGSLAFHPSDQLLAIATAHELYFWNWGKSSKPRFKVSTASRKERVRYVRFDDVGHTLITGIANLTPMQIVIQERERRERDRQFELDRENERSERQQMTDFFGLNRASGNSSSREVATTAAEDLEAVASGADISSGRFYRAMRALTDGDVTSGSSPGPPAPSASQTLTDLAQAATNQLMAETRNMRDSSVERDDLSAAESDHLYFSERARQSLDALRRMDTLRRFGLGDGSRDEDDAAVALADSRRRRSAMGRRLLLRDRIMRDRDRVRLMQHEIESIGQEERRTDPDSFGFRHYQGSQFHEVDSLRRTTEVWYRSPDPLQRAGFNARFQSRTSQRLRQLLDQRESLATQIEQIRMTRNLDSPSSSAGASPSSSGMLDEWASSVRRNQAIDAARTRGMVESSPRGVRATSLRANATRRQTSTSELLGASLDFLDFENDSRPSFRNEAVSPSTPDAPPTTGALNLSNSSSRDNSTPSTRTSNSLVATEQQENSSENIVHVLPLQRSPPRGAGAATPSNTEEPRPSTSADALAADEAAAAAAASNAASSNRQNMDIVLMSRHIEHMQQICRDSLSGLAETNQRRQLVRLQTIRKMLEDLQGKIRSLRAASQNSSEQRPAPSAPVHTPQEGATPERTPAPTTPASPPSASRLRLAHEGTRPMSSAYLSYRATQDDDSATAQPDPRLQRLGPRPYYSRYALYPRQEFDLFATAASNFNSPHTLPSTGPGSSRLLHAHLPGSRHLAPGSIPRRRGTRYAAAAMYRAGSRASAIGMTPPPTSIRGGSTPLVIGGRAATSRARLSRVQTRMVSQLHATFRAIEMSPDLALTPNNLLSQSRAEASREVMIMHQSEQNSSHGLRALSQRVERLLRSRREEAAAAGDDVPAGPDDDEVWVARDSSMHHEHNYSRSEEEALLEGIPRPGDPLERFDSRWRHFFDGIDHRLSSRETVRPFALPRNHFESTPVPGLDVTNVGTPGRRRRRLSNMSMEVASGYSDFSEVESDSSEQAVARRLSRWSRPYRRTNTATNDDGPTATPPADPPTVANAATTTTAAATSSPFSTADFNFMPSAAPLLLQSASERPPPPRSPSDSSGPGTPVDGSPPGSGSLTERFRIAQRRNREAYATIRERMDVRRGMRREVERERRRMSRDFAMAHRRGRYERELMDFASLTNSYPDVPPRPAAASTTTNAPTPMVLEPPPRPPPTGAESEADPPSRYPQLTRDMLFRRLRRRQTLAGGMDDASLEAALEGRDRSSSSRERSRERSESPSDLDLPSTSGGNRARERFSRDREMLSMVNQLTIDQANMAASAAVNPPGPPASGTSAASNSSASAAAAPPPYAPPTNSRRSVDARRRRYGYMRHLGDFDLGQHGGPPPPFMRSAGGTLGDSLYYSNAHPQPTHRIQAWDFGNGMMPDLTNTTDSIVVQEARIHNDASVDVSRDGTLLVTLVPSNIPTSMLVGVYSLEKGSLGSCHATYCLESSAVSVSLSPTSRHLLVGLTTRAHSRISLSPAGSVGERSILGQVFRLKLPCEQGGGSRGRLVFKKDFVQGEHAQTALNCMRWIPVSGQGIVYATNTGLLKMMK